MYLYTLCDVASATLIYITLRDTAMLERLPSFYYRTEDDHVIIVYNTAVLLSCLTPSADRDGWG